MRFTTVLSALCVITGVTAQQRTAQLYLQPLSTTSKPEPLAEISYDPAAVGSSSIVSYEPPELDESTPSLVRIGLYDKKSAQWISGTTVASSENFGKGYAPNLILNVDARGEVLSTAVKGVRIDAGQTRDFGPQAVVLVEAKGKQPELNKPVVLSPEGKKVEEVEKTFLQKYVFLRQVSASGGSLRDMLLIVLQVLVDACYRGHLAGRWRRRQIDHDAVCISKLMIESLRTDLCALVTCVLILLHFVDILISCYPIMTLPEPLSLHVTSRSTQRYVLRRTRLRGASAF